MGLKIKITPKILNTFKCKKETFRVHILDPKADIRAHRDFGYRLEDGKIRIHIPVETNSNVQLLLNDQPIKMKEGECWYCNFHIKHEVHNKSNQPRTHLILDCMVNDWLEKTVLKYLYSLKCNNQESQQVSYLN